MEGIGGKSCGLVPNNLSYKHNNCNIKRAHQIGTPAANKNWFTMVKLTNFKKKESISCKPKLKKSDFAITEDFISALHRARSKLLKFSKPQKCTFKFRLTQCLEFIFPTQ